MTDAAVKTRPLQRLRIDDPFETIMGAVDADGGAIVADFIDAATVARLNQELAASIEDTAPGSTSVGPDMAVFWGANTKRFTRMAARAPSFVPIIEHELMHHWARHSLAGGYWLNTGQAMIVGPGEPAQYLHRDTAIWPLISELGAAAPNAMVSAMIALSDFTEAVGATRVIPGSHRWDDFHRQPHPDEAVGAVMPAGSALLYAGKTVHAAGANVTQDQWRRGLHISFCLSWLTPEEASPIGVPWSLAQTFSPRVQQMLGYASTPRAPGAPPLNWLVDFEDTRKFLKTQRDG